MASAYNDLEQGLGSEPETEARSRWWRHQILATRPSGQWQGSWPFSSVKFSYSVVSDSLRPHELQHARPPCPSPNPRFYSNSCPLSQWCHPTISSSVIPFFCLQSFPASGSFPVSQFFASGDQSIGASASVLPINIQDWSPSEWTGWISLQSKGPSRVFSNTTVQKQQFFGTQPSLWSSSHIHTWALKLLYTTQMTNKDLLYSTGNYT